MTEKEMMQEVEVLATKCMNDEITFQEFITEIQKYPADIKDRGLALAILKRGK